jgi:hypothetical protein
MQYRTRLIITRMRKYVHEGKIISGSNIGDKVLYLDCL